MSANSNDSEYSNFCVGTSVVETDAINCEVVLIRKGSYSSNISFPVVTAPLSQSRFSPQLLQASSSFEKKKVIDSNQNSVYTYGNLQTPGSEVESLDNYLYHYVDLEEQQQQLLLIHDKHQLANKVPSFFNRILAPPSAFADDRNQRKSKDCFREITSIIEDLPSRGVSSYVRTATRSKLADQCSQQQKQSSSLSKPATTKASIQNSCTDLNIFSPTITTHSANLSLHISRKFNEDMGWGQPTAVVGKRVRNDMENNANSGYSTSDTDEEMRVHLQRSRDQGVKRSRDVSPIKSTYAIIDFTNLPSGACPTFDSSFHRDCGSTEQASASLEPNSSLSSESYHSTSVISTTTNGMTAQDFSHDVQFGDQSHLDPRHQMLYNFHHQQQETTPTYVDHCLPPSDCFLLDSHRHAVFTTPSSGDNFNTNCRDHMPKLGSIQISDHTEHTIHDQHEAMSRIKDRMVVPPPSEPIVMSSSSCSSSSSASSVSATLQDVRISPSRSVPRFKGPRVATARGVRTSKKNYSARKHKSPSYTIIKSIKNPTQNATTMGKDVNESEEEDDAEDSEYEGGDTVVDDTSTCLKGDEAIEDDASTSTDIALPTIVRKIVPPIRPSYFANVPPYINFCSHDEKSETLPLEIRKHLKWRMSTITPVVIRKTIANSGFRLLKKTVDWGGQWGKHMKATMFRSTLKEHQKLNHLPGTFQLGRKDRLWKNIYRFMLKYGKTQYGFLPRTYILPHDMKQLKHAWDAGESRGGYWIVKPPAGARGTGIRVINKWNMVPKKRPIIVQEYISKPLLINDRKFDLRLYVLVTSFHPLRIYLFKDGLVRFASVKYSHDSKRVADRYMHLTNYSINKNCDLYTQNEDANACKGHKWTLKTLWRYLRARGTDTTTIIKRIEDIVLKTLISAEECITNACSHMPNRYNGYELFGFDIILDETLKPWLLEVNISPSLHSSSPLDLAVKGPLVKEVFNIVGYHLPPSLSKQAKKNFVERLDKDLELEKPVWDKRIYTTVRTREEKMKQQLFRAKYDDRAQYLTDILETLTPDDIRHLVTAEDELSQCDGFTRIFPTRNTYSYFAFFEGQPRYYNMLMDAWENKYELDRAPAIYRLQDFCRRKIHLITAPVISQPTLDNQDGIGEPVTIELSPLKKNFLATTTSFGAATREIRKDPAPTPYSPALVCTSQNQSAIVKSNQNHQNYNDPYDEDQQCEPPIYLNNSKPLESCTDFRSGTTTPTTTTCTTNTNLNIPRGNGIPAFVKNEGPPLPSRIQHNNHMSIVRTLSTQPQEKQQPVVSLSKPIPISSTLSPHTHSIGYHDENHIMNNNSVDTANTPVNEYNKIKGICY